MTIKSTEIARADLDRVWLMIMESPSNSDPMRILEKLHPIVLALVRHIDDLQAEVNALIEKVK